MGKSYWKFNPIGGMKPPSPGKLLGKRKVPHFRNQIGLLSWYARISRYDSCRDSERGINEPINLVD